MTGLREEKREEAELRRDRRPAGVLLDPPPPPPPDLEAEPLGVEVAMAPPVAPPPNTGVLIVDSRRERKRGLLQVYLAYRSGVELLMYIANCKLLNFVQIYFIEYLKNYIEKFYKHHSNCTST